MVTLVCAVVWMLKMIDKWVVSMTAIVNGMTIAEFQNSWSYKYLFE